MNNKLNLIALLFITLFFYFIAFAVSLKWLPMSVMAVYVIVSIITFLLYMKDKSAAQKNHWRIKESTLLVFGLFCGWPGALFAQRMLHHKTKKTEFQLVYWLTVIIHCGALASMLYIKNTWIIR
ncbi:DUF1294 domain-containing protein [Budvicia diplopodorum]|uniref:DUF1294 domain-containing protein n=1 Tax=Budvicia diplopodorum TaxID=1119056 RepID=UPI00135832C8|nr:DUF1294 domain-containing protein [Budvicia diplopodorum]